MFLDQFLEWAHAGLLENEDAQSYLLGRGISRDQWASHRIGFTEGDFDVDPESHPGHSDSCSDREKKHLRCDACRYRSWSSVWESRDDEPGKTQVVGKRIRGCVVFPLTSYSGARVGFQTRSIVEKAYDSFMLTKRPEGYFFGSSSNYREVWATGEVALIEGAGDQLLIERLVMPNVLAITTSGLSRLQLQYVKRFARRVIFFMDLDAAGRTGVRSFVADHGSSFDILDIKYPRIGPKDKDPGDFWKKVGDEAFAHHFEKALGRRRS
ncbi:MAG: DNA primase [Synergistetes bacterium ADurb.BinA166]|nr:MAG: DNA primase [Synergistetes bacterium ADurb.BinA166]